MSEAEKDLVNTASNMIMKYFAYGSNLNKEDLVKQCKKKRLDVPKLVNPKPFCLENYKLGFTRKSDDRKGGVADIIFSPGDFCCGVVFDVTQTDLDILDVKEGVEYGSYRQITLPNGMITYKVVKKENFVQPSDEYIDLIIQGANYYDLPPSWIDKLESFKR